MENNLQNIKNQISKPVSYYKHWKYKNTFLLIISLALFLYFADTPIVAESIKKFGSFGYIGAFFAGVFFVSIFTVAPALIVLYFLAETLNSYEVALFAGLGAVLGDYLIFRFLKDRVFEELKPIYNRLGGSFIKKIFQTPYFTWLMPIIGAGIITSPLPDEIGIGILGLGKVTKRKFLLISFLLNAIGILIIVTLAKL